MPAGWGGSDNEDFFEELESLVGPPDLPGEGISGDHPVAPRHPSVEGNESGFLLQTPQSGGAATIIAAHFHARGINATGKNRERAKLEGTNPKGLDMAMDYSKLRDALVRLQEQLQNYSRMDARPELTEVDREAIRDSSVKRFEFAFEMSWKLLKRHLTEELGLADTPSSPKPILRIAAENNLLQDRIDRWLLYADARVNTAHDYSGEKAKATLALAPDFLQDALHLYQTMTGEAISAPKQES